MRALAGSFETSDAVLAAMQSNDLYKRPDDYQATLVQRWQALTLPQVTAGIKAARDPAKTVWVVVGDARVVRPQLASLGLPMEVTSAAAVGGATAAAAVTTAGQ